MKRRTITSTFLIVAALAAFALGSFSLFAPHRRNSNRSVGPSLVNRASASTGAIGHDGANPGMTVSGSRRNDGVSTPPPKDAPPDERKGAKRLILVRHGTSVANEAMDRPGNRWGDPTFVDDASLRDSPLSGEGTRQAEELRSRWRTELLVADPDCLAGERAEDGGGIDVDLVVVSPLTRALQTFDAAVRPNLPGDGNVPVLAHPLATERVYTGSDIGRSSAELKAEFPSVDFDSAFSGGESSSWWFSPPEDAEYAEWRPHGRGQSYSVRGEPEGAFDARMRKLRDWIASREERTIVLVTHWGVIRWLSGEEFANCEARIVDFG